jgi:hypothetical protein
VKTYVHLNIWPLLNTVIDTNAVSKTRQHTEISEIHVTNILWSTVHLIVSHDGALRCVLKQSLFFFLHIIREFNSKGQKQNERVWSVTLCRHFLTCSDYNCVPHVRYLAYTYLLLDLMLLIVLLRSKQHEASHYEELSSRLSLSPSPVQKFSTAPRSETPCTSVLPLMWHPMDTSFFKHTAIRFLSTWTHFVIVQCHANSMDTTHTHTHTHIRPHVTSSNYIVLQPIALRFHNKTTRMSERDQWDDEAQLQFWSRGNKSIYS